MICCSRKGGRKSATRALQLSAGYWLTCFSLNSRKQPSLSWFEVLLWDVWSQTRTDVNICHERVQRFRLPHLPEPWLNSCHFYSDRGAIAISFMYLLISSALLMCVCFRFSATAYVSRQLSHTVSWLYTLEQLSSTEKPTDPEVIMLTIDQHRGPRCVLLCQHSSAVITLSCGCSYSTV